MSAKPKAEMMRELRRKRKNSALVKCEVYIPEDCKDRLSNYVEKRLGGIYSPKGVDVESSKKDV